MSLPVTAPFSYAARSALRIFSRDALTAGRNPPSNPIISEKKRDQRTIFGDREKLKASSENEAKLIMETEKN